MKRLLMSIAIIFLAGCASAGYQCPFNNKPGTCSSQLNAYQSSFNQPVNSDSLFSTKQLREVESINSGVTSSNERITAELEGKTVMNRTWIAPYKDEEGHIVDSHIIYWIKEPAMTLENSFLLKPSNELVNK
jgi:hypothetical protein